jgi:S-adenosylmethionine hydrolase
MPIITLTTDFGPDSPYVAAMKGVILSIQRGAASMPTQKQPSHAPIAGSGGTGEGLSDGLIVDVTHSVPPQDIRAGALVLADTCRWFPAGTIHIVVVDPGVGTDRRVLCVNADHQLIVGPDNGVLAPAVRDAASIDAYEITEPRYRLPEVSNTFHGRDIMAPAAAHLSLGVAPMDLGPPVDDWVRLELPEPVVHAGWIEGKVLFVDSFGNLISNIKADVLAAVFGDLDKAGVNVTVTCGPHVVPGLVRAYADATHHATAALIGSSGRLEIAVVNGNASKQLALTEGAAVIVQSTV